MTNYDSRIRYVEPPAGLTLPEHWRRPSEGTLENYRRSQILGMVATHHPALRQPAAAIERDAVQSRATHNLVDSLMRAYDAEKAAGRSIVGLAANQMGFTQQVLLAKIEGDEPTVMINPSLHVPEGAPTSTNREGCFSCGPVVGSVTRPSQVQVRWTDLKGKRQEDKLSGFHAAVVGHEVGHLDGRLFTDHVTPGELDWVDPELKTYYRDIKDAGEPWLQGCPTDQWEAMCRSDGVPGDTFRLGSFYGITTIVSESGWIVFG